MNYNIKLPEKIRLIKADNLQGFENGLNFNQKIVTPNEVKTFNIEYLEDLDPWERILNDPLFNLFWAWVGGFIGAFLGIIFGFKWKKIFSYKSKWWLEHLCKSKSNTEIADKYGVTPQTICYWRKKFKI